jgi:hypothetical protein
MNKLSAYLEHLSTSRNTLIATLFMLIFLAVFAPRLQARMQPYSDQGGSVDLSFFYTAEQLYETAEAYGEDGRRTYASVRFTYDLAFPLVYTFFFATLITYTFRTVFPLDSPLQKLNLIAVAALVFDLLENSGATIVMLTYPTRFIPLAWATAVFTTIKWLTVGTTAILALVGLVAWVGKSLLRR